jgi:hypothetical protein
MYAILQEDEMTIQQSASGGGKSWRRERAVGERNHKGSEAE